VRLEVGSDKAALSRPAHQPSPGCYATGNAPRWVSCGASIPKEANRKLTQCRIIYFTFYWNISPQILCKSKVTHVEHEWKPEFKAEGNSRCVYEIEPTGASAKLTLTHSIERPDSKFIGAVSEGWPLVISNLKSLLETGEVAVVYHRGHGD
jgi:hypothetical protein